MNLNLFTQIYAAGTNLCVPSDEYPIQTCINNPPGFGSGTGNLTSIYAILSGSGSNPGLISYFFTISGIILLLMIISSGYGLLTSVGNPEGIEKAKKRLTASLTGFMIIFAAFWIYQLVAVFIGLNTNFT